MMQNSTCVEDWSDMRELLNADWAQQRAEDWSYEGLNCAVIIRRLFELGRERGTEIFRDLVCMVSFAVVRGNILSLMEAPGSLSQSGLDRIAELKNIYRLRSGNPANMEDITLARVSLALAPLTCQFLRRTPALCDLPVAHSTMLQESEDYPIAMMHPAFGSFLGSELDPTARDQLKRAHSLYLYHFTLLIRPNLKTAPARVVIESFSGGLEAAMRVTFMDGGKQFLLERLGVLHEGQATQAVLTAAAAFDRIAGQ